MFAIQLTIFSIALFILLTSVYYEASEETSKTKIAMIEVMNKRFFENSLKNIALQALEVNEGNCFEKMKNAGKNLEKLAGKLKEKGIEMVIGFEKQGECQCGELGKIVQIEEILECIDGKILLSKANSLGLPVMRFAWIENENQLLTKVGGETR